MMIVLRLLHVGLGVFWAGSLLFIALFLEPSVRAALPESGKVMQQLAKRRLLGGRKILEPGHVPSVIAHRSPHLTVADDIDAGFVLVQDGEPYRVIPYFLNVDRAQLPASGGLPKNVKPAGAPMAANDARG